MSWYSIDGATAKQHDLLLDAIQGCTYPFGERFTEIDGCFVAFSFSDDPLPHYGRDVAATTMGDTLNACGVPDSASVVLLNGLESQVPFGIGHRFVKGSFFKEVVVHELGHVVSSWLNEEQIDEICDLFGGARHNWSGDVSDSHVKWEDLIKEAQAEFFKDVFYPDRLFDNRTNWQMPKANFDSWAAIMDTLVCCPEAGGT